MCARRTDAEKKRRTCVRARRDKFHERRFVCGKRRGRTRSGAATCIVWRYDDRYTSPCCRETDVFGKSIFKAGRKEATDVCRLTVDEFDSCSPGEGDNRSYYYPGLNKKVLIPHHYSPRRRYYVPFDKLRLRYSHHFSKRHWARNFFSNATASDT